jgi:exodeoxyribonuclease I
VKANAQPILLPRALAGPDLHALSIDNDEIERRAQLVLEADGFRTRVGEAISNRYPPREASAYVEEKIYDGFPSRADEWLMQQFHQVPWKKRAAILEQVHDPRIRELGYRLIYTECPQYLSDQKRAELHAWFVRRLHPNMEVPWRTIAGALDQVEDLLAEGIENRELIVEVKLWLESINSTIEHEAATDCAPLSQTAQGNGSIVTTPVLSGLHYRYART